jgi:hypothetical protein
MIFLAAVLPQCAPCEAIHQAVKVPGLQQLARHSGLIFSGTVIRVEHLNSTGTDGPTITQTTFRVQQAIRGVRAGQIVDVQEWAGCGR